MIEKDKMMKKLKNLLFSIGVLLTLALTANSVQARSYSDSQLSSLTFNKNEIVTVDHNRPQFSKKLNPKNAALGKNSATSTF